MKRVLLINTNTETLPYPVPPLGLCLVAASLRGAYQVRTYDGAFDRGANLPAVIAEFAPDYVGVSIRNIDGVVGPAYYIDAIQREFIEPIRRATRAPLILGGAGFSIFARPLMTQLAADYGIIGEGELAFPALLACLQEGGDPSVIPGVFSGQPPAPGAHKLGLHLACIDQQLDFTPYVARGAYPIQTKRGCAHKCIYCTYPNIEGSHYRLRSPVAVVDEIEETQRRLGDICFEFVDSTFNDPAGHAEAICQEIIRRGLQLRLRTMGINPGSVTRELLQAMKAAGFAQIDCGPDSASPAMLARLGKGFSRAQLEHTAQLIRELALPTMWCFILGGPGETAATIDETFDFIDHFIDPLDMVHLTEGLRIYPDTPLYQVALKAGLVSSGDDLLRPVRYFSPALGPARLAEIVRQKSAARPNCMPATESTPNPELLKKAIAERQRLGLNEPMFRTLLRLRRQLP